MYAFGLEECGFYEKAEREARFGLEQQPQDCWSTVCFLSSFLILSIYIYIFFLACNCTLHGNEWKI